MDAEDLPGGGCGKPDQNADDVVKEVADAKESCEGFEVSRWKRDVEKVRRQNCRQYIGIKGTHQKENTSTVTRRRRRRGRGNIQAAESLK